MVACNDDIIHRRKIFPPIFIYKKAVLVAQASTFMASGELKANEKSKKLKIKNPNRGKVISSKVVNTTFLVVYNKISVLDSTQ